MKSNRRSMSRTRSFSSTILNTLHGSALFTAAAVMLIVFSTTGRAVVFTNGTTINIPDAASVGAANPYPMNLNVSGMTGTVTNIKVTLRGFTHTFPDDMDIMLVSPSGQTLLLMSDAGGSIDAEDLNLTFDDAAAAGIPDGGPLYLSGSYQVSQFTVGDTFPAPAPAPSANTTLASAFNGIDPNGTWSLYLVDDTGVDTGYLRNGYSITVTTGGTSAKTFTNSTRAFLNDRWGEATSSIVASGLPNQLTNVKVTLNNLNHSNPDDLDVTLVAPDGTNMIFMSDSGGTADVANTTVTFDDAASSTIPDAGPLVAGTFLPANFGSGDTITDVINPLPNAATAGTATFTNVFHGVNPNGTWRLIVNDDATANTGDIAGGWSLDITGAAAAAGTVPAAGRLIISEFHGRTSIDTSDEFIEVYNTSATPITVQASDASEGIGIATSDGTLHGFIPNGTTIPGHGHYLLENGNFNASSPFNVYPGVDGSSPTPARVITDSFSTGSITDRQGIGLFTSTSTFTAGTRLDAIGPTEEANPLFREGPGFATIVDTPPSLFSGSQFESWVRRVSRVTGFPIDTGDNYNDFRLVDPRSTNIVCGASMGAPSPEDLAGPVNLANTLPVSAVDPGCTGVSADPNSACGIVDDGGTTFSVRRKFTNNTGVLITRLRFRIGDLTVKPSTAGVASLGAINSTDSTKNLAGGGTTSLQGLTIEVGTNGSPNTATQPDGGGINSSLTDTDVTPASPLAIGASINVEFLFNKIQAGSYDMTISSEALPTGGGAFSVFSSDIADLSITKTDNRTTVGIGGVATYTIVATNSGPNTVTGATVSDPLPMNAASASWTCTGSGGATCTAAGVASINDAAVNLPSGGAVTYTVNVVVAPGATGTLSNTATITPPAGIVDRFPCNATAVDIDTLAALTTASGVSVGGRLRTATGRGVGSALVTLTNSQGVTSSSYTDRMGRFNFEGVTVGQTYILTAGSGRYIVEPITVVVNDSVSDLDIVASTPN